MFSRIWTKPYTKSCSEQIERLKAALQDCDAVVIGAGAGLSTSAGFVYTGERFEKYFSDKVRHPRFVFRRLLSLCHAGGALELLEPIHLYQPLYGCPQTGLR